MEKVSRIMCVGYDLTNRNFINGTADRNMINVYNSSQAGAKFRE
jgi:hypothetical protein